MSWERTHTKASCIPPLFGNIFARAGAIWKCEECGNRYEVTKTSNGSGWKKLS